MVDRITGDNTNPIQDSLRQLQNRSDVQEVKPQSVRELQAASVNELLSDDEAEISTQAKKLSEAVRFGRAAERLEEPFDADKVARLKDLVNSGRINEYLRSINTDELAQSILESPTGNFLKQ